MITELSISALTTYGFAPELVQCFAADGVERLLPLQARGITATDLLRGGSILALAPTSAGKTLLGELAACRHWQAGRKAIFLSPTKALVAAQYQHLRRRYGGLGIRVVMATADHTEHDDDIRSGTFDFAVMVYEKARSFVISEPAMVCSTGVVIADELQVLHDAERGHTADMLLSRLHACDVPVQIIGLSAVLDRADEIASWLDAEILTSSARPCELREGAWCVEHGAFHYKLNDEWKDEALDGGVPADSRSFGSLSRTDGLPQAAALAVEFARRGENCLLFVPTRRLSRQVALAAAQELGISDGWDARDCPELALSEESTMRQQLEMCLPAAVAFHNSDLTAELRDAVERGFNDGRIKILVATPTLAQGVNLRAKNVIHVPLMLGSALRAGGNSHRRPQVSLSVDRYKNQAGRAGRYGLAQGFGRSILVARTHAEAIRLARQYIEAPAHGVVSPVRLETMEAFVLDLVEAGIAATFSELVKAFGNTFTWHGAVQGEESAQVEDELAECIQRLMEWNLLEETPSSRLLVTGLGQAAAMSGLRASTIRELMRWCGQWAEGVPGEMEILLACALTEDAEIFPVSAAPEEIRCRRWMSPVEAMLRRENAWENPAVQAALRPPGGLSPTRHGLIKMVAISAQWISRRETAELESDLATSAGAMGAMAAHLAWIAAGLQSCAQVAGCSEETIGQIRRLAARLPYGVARKASGLAAVRVPGLTRNYLHRLADAGFDSVSALKSAGADVLAGVVPPVLAQRIAARYCEAPPVSAAIAEKKSGQIRDAASAVVPRADTAQNGHARQALGAEFELVLDQHNPGTVVFRGQTVQLSPKPYALLGVLASRCGSTVSYSEIDEKVWPEEKVEPQQISAHKSRLVKELARASTLQEAQKVIVTAPRYGLRLNLQPGRVQVR